MFELQRRQLPAQCSFNIIPKPLAAKIMLLGWKTEKVSNGEPGGMNNFSQHQSLGKMPYSNKGKKANKIGSIDRRTTVSQASLNSEV